MGRNTQQVTRILSAAKIKQLVYNCSNQPGIAQQDIKIQFIHSPCAHLLPQNVDNNPNIILSTLKI
jgi:hypothetical protein